MRCACGKYCKPRWVGFYKTINWGECKTCAAKREMTARLRQEVERARMIQDWEREMNRFMMGL